MTKKEKLLVSYDESEIVDFRIQEMLDEWEVYYPEKTEKPNFDEVQADVLNDSDIFRFEWEYITDTLTELMRGNTQWKASVSNFGWRNLEGVKEFTAENGQELLQEILPNTECAFYIYKYKNGFKMQNYHHDSPMGNEWYYILPIK